ncbi:hypothetical protein [Rhodoferax sp.]|uniref:hypothetical protein n=1 Tax=Rhodoferax sp. TaxID=50421 RepID=UPI00274A28D6|nr:hypothetical protein [Rhodoferax sp.]
MKQTRNHETDQVSNRSDFQGHEAANQRGTTAERETEMAKAKQMTQTEAILHAALEPRHGQPYATDKVAEIKGMSSAQVLEWSTVHLDPQNRSAFFRAVGIDDSVETASILRRSFAAMKHPCS